jgi:hypothetical protein
MPHVRQNFSEYEKRSYTHFFLFDYVEAVCEEGTETLLSSFVSGYNLERILPFKLPRLQVNEDSEGKMKIRGELLKIESQHSAVSLHLAGVGWGSWQLLSLAECKQWKLCKLD